MTLPRASSASPWRPGPIAPVHPAPRHHTIERRHDLRVGEQRLDLLYRRGGDVDLVGREVAVRFRNAEISLGDISIGVHLIEGSVADELPSFAQLFPIFRQGVLKRYVRLVVIQLPARAHQRTALGFELSLGFGKLLLHFGKVNYREHLTRFHVIADVDANIRQVSGDLGEEVRFLKGFERGVGLETLGHRGAARMHNLDPRRTVRLR